MAPNKEETITLSQDNLNYTPQYKQQATRRAQQPRNKVKSEALASDNPTKSTLYGTISTNKEYTPTLN